MIAERLKNKLRECIRLHENMKRLFHEESGCIINDSPEGMSDRIGKCDLLQMRIARANQELTELFDRYSMQNGGQASEEIRSLFKQLRHSIFSTIGIVNETFDSVKMEKTRVSGKLKNMRRAKVAINAYAKTG